MHEASLVSSLLRQVDDLAVANGGGRVAEIRIEVGPLSGVEPLLLREAFHRLRPNTYSGTAELVVEFVKLTYRCRSCGRRHVTDELRFACEDCGGGDVEILAGDTVVLQSISLEQTPEESTSP
ncbi:MAG: hydrogenase maturation nickel metallochaperone HypA [Planctomycetia bacterium]|nr:hydrogenase maturation nickel metallochaperone HypA [Planctomycetia bacterium]